MGSVVFIFNPQVCDGVRGVHVLPAGLWWGPWCSSFTRRFVMGSVVFIFSMICLVFCLFLFVFALDCPSVISPSVFSNFVSSGAYRRNTQIHLSILIHRNTYRGTVQWDVSGIFDRKAEDFDITSFIANANLSFEFLYKMTKILCSSFKYMNNKKLI
jgi:hypothetical protein